MLIVAQSGQLLAQAAHKLGLKFTVIDCYADVDTQALACQVIRVESLAVADLRKSIVLLKHPHRDCLYGSGFEFYPESLFFLEKQFRLMGNSAKVFQSLQNKPLFFQRLQVLNIPFPKVFFKKKPTVNGYLAKPFQSLGGVNIYKPNKSHPLNPRTHYYQQYLQGLTLSVLFVGNCQQALIIGFNQQWQRPHSFIFAGIINHTPLSKTHQQIIQQWLNQLTLSYSLVGLCGLDFIFYENKCYVLELNPRPPASMVLYQQNILLLHLLSHQQQLQPDDLLKHTDYRAYQIIYAPTTFKISSQIAWLTCCSHLPQIGVIIKKHQPICSMIISGKNPKRLLEDLNKKQALLLTQINR